MCNFYRVSNAVIAPDLMREMTLSSESIGVLTGAFHLAFAAIQIPVGMMLDRFGARMTIPGMMAFAVAGSLWFAVAQDMAGLSGARILMGIGCASVFMGSLVVCTRWFPPDRFATIAAALVAVGNLGNLLATTPLAVTAEAIGWRGSFIATATLTALCGIVGYAVIRDAPPGHDYHNRSLESPRAVFRGAIEVAFNPRLLVHLPINFVGYVSMLTVLGLWGGPYLNDVHGLGAVPRGNILLVMALFFIFGTLGFGPLDRLFDTRKWVTFWGGLASVVVLALLALLPSPDLWLVTVLFAALGGLNGFTLMALAHGRTIFPDRLVGRGMAILSFAAMSGIATMQMLAGVIVGRFAGPDGLVSEEGYRYMFAFIAVLLAAALLVYARSEDARPSADLRAAPRSATD